MNAIPPASCQSKWCQRVRVTHRIAHRLLAGLQRWERAGGNVSPLSDMPVLLDIVRATRAEGISPFAVVSIAGKESSFGVQSCGFVSTGLGSCWAAGNWTSITLCGKRYHGPSYVTSWARGLGLTAKLIRCLWPRAVTTWDLAGYAASSSWKGDVDAIARQYFRTAPYVKWRKAVELVS